jgi:hypothetical protein
MQGAADWVLMPLGKVVSGGQTGVDRGALDAALAAGFPCGGWCPGDRRAEDGTIPAHYPLSPLPSAGYRQRTRQNVIDSDGTLILFDGALAGGELTGGTLLTAKFASEYGRPLLQVDSSKYPAPQAIGTVRAWLGKHDIKVLNVAGPRASGWPQGHEYTRQLLELLLRT